jgi:formylglycine-generating enzyme required for sulfatase activity
MGFSHIFVAHSSVDQDTAQQMLQFLEARGIRCWIAPRDIPLGQQWAEAILDAIEEASAMLLVFSANSNDSPQVLREVERAVSMRVPIYPVKIEDVEPCRAMEYYLSSHQWKEVFKGDVEEKLTHLVPTIVKHLGIDTPEARQALSEALARGEEIDRKPPVEGASLDDERASRPRRKKWLFGIPVVVALAVLAAILLPERGERGPQHEGVPPDTSAMTDTVPEVVPDSLEAMSREAGDLSAGPVPGMTFSYIPSGSFLMGSPDTEPGRDTDEGPQVEIEIGSPFEIMTTEVRQETWLSVTGENPSFNNSEGCPVENVSWDECQDFLDALNELDPDHTYRLPSEAEWEYACRASSSSSYYWGEDTTESVMSGFCWYETNSGGNTHPVGLKAPNDWQLHDMVGNVLEWCQDFYSPDLEAVPPGGEPVLLPNADTTRVVRGGSSRNSPAGSRSSSRSAYSQTGASPGIGLRVVREVAD